MCLKMQYKQIIYLVRYLHFLWDFEIRRVKKGSVSSTNNIKNEMLFNFPFHWNIEKLKKHQIIYSKYFFSREKFKEEVELKGNIV